MILFLFSFGLNLNKIYTYVEHVVTMIYPLRGSQYRVFKTISVNTVEYPINLLYPYVHPFENALITPTFCLLLC